MTRPQVPVTLPRAHFLVDADGHLTVTIDSQPWQPPADRPAATSGAGVVRLGRSDVRWAQQQIADELGTPILVQVFDGGGPYSDVIVPDGYEAADPNAPQEASPPVEGRFVPGEPVVISVVVDDTRADEHGHVHYRLPLALGGRAVLVHGQASGVTVPLDQQPGARRAPSPGTTAQDAAPAPRRAPGQRGFDARRVVGPRPVPPSPDPLRARGVGPDAGLGAL